MLAINRKHSDNPKRCQSKQAPVYSLQQAQANYTLPCSRAIQRKSLCTCGGTCPKCQGDQSLQPKLRISAPDDKYEREADHVADQVMRSKGISFGVRMPEPALQRQPAEEDGDMEIMSSGSQVHADEEETLQAKGTSGTRPAMSAGAGEKIRSLQGGGQPLPEAERLFFESRMGHDFRHVRIHDGEAAAEAAQSVNARSFTLGRDVVFNQGEYSPGTSSGKRLLAHELTHVVQQLGTAPQRATVNSSRIAPSSPGIQRKVDAAKCGKTGLEQSQCDMIDSDYEIALRYVPKAINKLGKTPYKPEVVRALKLYFNINGYEHRQTLINNLRRVHKILQHYKSHVSYTRGHPNGCKDPSVRAYSRPATIRKDGTVEPNALGWCLPYLNDKSQKRRVRTLIHEHAHAAGMVYDVHKGEKEIRVGSEGHFFIKSSRLLRSADSYAYLVMAVATSSPVDLSVGGEIGALVSASSKSRAAVIIRVYFDLSSRSPIFKIFFPYLRFGVTVMATPSRAPRTGGEIRYVDTAYLLELLVGTRIRLRKSTLGANWYISLGGGGILVVNDIRDEQGKVNRVSGGVKASLAGVVKIRDMEFKATAAYLYLPGIPGFKHSVQGSLTAGWRFTWP